MCAFGCKGWGGLLSVPATEMLCFYFVGVRFYRFVISFDDSIYLICFSILISISTQSQGGKTQNHRKREKINNMEMGSSNQPCQSTSGIQSNPVSCLFPEWSECCTFCFQFCWTSSPLEWFRPFHPSFQNHNVMAISILRRQLTDFTQKIVPS